MRLSIFFYAMLCKTSYNLPSKLNKKHKICVFSFSILLVLKVYVQVIPNSKTTQKGLLQVD
ncbi:hypothetical protein FC685_17855 [Bacillus cereus]|nr:hypothetical protein FC685_17855 [Bacillus cereus]